MRKEESEEDESEEESEEENEEEDEENEEEDAGPIEPPTGSLVIHACACAEKGDELFNTFGQQNNASLLHKYGFCEHHNAYTNVSVDVALVEDLVGGTKVRDAAAEGVDVADDAYFEIEPDGTIEARGGVGQGAQGRGRGGRPDDGSPDVQASLRTILERAAMYVGRGKGKEGEESGAIPRKTTVRSRRRPRAAERWWTRRGRSATPSSGSLAIERNCGVGNKRRRV